MNNMEVYEKVRSVPPEALKPIIGGRLKGMSDINPMWRIKMLTETFGICGIGWKTEIVEKRLEHGSGDEIVCFVDINLYVKVEGEWSAPIPGMGGSSFVTQERNGLYTSDECFKMAYTDAISVACKSLGFAADVYFEKDRTKYTDKGQDDNVQAPQKPVQQAQNNVVSISQQRPQSAPQGNTGTVTMVSEGQVKYIGSLKSQKKISDEEYRSMIAPKTSTKDLTMAEAKNLINQLQAYVPPQQPTGTSDDDLPF